MKKHEKKPDLDLLAGLLSITAGSRHEIIKEIWFHPDHKIRTWDNPFREMLTKHRSEINRKMYGFLTSETMTMKHPGIKKVVRMDISELKSCVIIMLMLGIPAEEAADISLTSTAYIRFVLEEYPDLL